MDDDDDELPELTDFNGVPLGRLLIEATLDNNIAEVYRLIENGANINYQEMNGYTALLFASRTNRREIAYILIQAGADINIRNSNGYTPLMLATIMNNLEIIDMLIQAGANLNIQDNIYGNTALIVAVEDNYTEIVKSLVRGGADIYIENSEGLNAIDMMDENTNRTIRQLLSSRVARETLNRHEVEGLRNFYPPHPIPSLQKIAYDAVIKAKKRDMSNLTHEERIDINRINSNLYPHSKPHLTKYVRKNRNRSHSPYRRIRMEQKRLSEPRNITQKHRSSPRRRSRGRSISSSSSTLRGSSRGRSRGSSTSSSTSSSRGRSRGRSRERR